MSLVDARIAYRAWVGPSLELLRALEGSGLAATMGAEIAGATLELAHASLVMGWLLGALPDEPPAFGEVREHGPRAPEPAASVPHGVPACPTCLGAVLPGQGGPCPHCGSDFTAGSLVRHGPALGCRCLVLGVNPPPTGPLGAVSPPGQHHACPVHGDRAQLDAAELRVREWMVRADALTAHPSNPRASNPAYQQPTDRGRPAPAATYSGGEWAPAEQWRGAQPPAPVRQPGPEPASRRVPIDPRRGPVEPAQPAEPPLP